MSTDAVQALARKYERVTGSIPVGMTDMLSILATHCRDEFVAWLSSRDLTPCPNDHAVIDGQVVKVERGDFRAYESFLHGCIVKFEPDDLTGSHLRIVDGES